MARTKFNYLVAEEDNSLEVELREELSQLQQPHIGRPPGYSPKYDDICYRANLFLGCTDRQLQRMLGITKSTFYRWRLQYPSFADSIQRGKDEFDSENVEKSVLRRALGYNFKQQIIKRKPMHVNENGEVLFATEHTEKDVHIPADVQAGFRWLYNRRSHRWKDMSHRVNELTGPDGKPLNINHEHNLKLDLSQYGTGELKVLLGIVSKNNPQLLTTNLENDVIDI